MKHALMITSFVPIMILSGRAFLWLKLVNIVIGLLLGLVGLYALH